MNAENFGLVLNFVVREGRYLRTRETSFSEKELNEGKKSIKKILATIRKKAGKDLPKVLESARKRNKLVGVVCKSLKKFSRKNVSLVIENYKLFNSVFARDPIKRKSAKLASDKSDRYYVPKMHFYR